MQGHVLDARENKERTARKPANQKTEGGREEQEKQELPGEIDHDAPPAEPALFGSSYQSLCQAT